MQFEVVLAECEILIRAGQIDLVRKTLSTLPTHQVPREFMLPVAAMCRRCGLNYLGLRFLSPLVHVDKGNWRSEATPTELAEYAVLLHRSGAIQEALWVLGKIDPAKVPETHLHRALCEFGMWEYPKAAESLRKFLASELTPYQRIIGHVNYAAALVVIGKSDEALSILNDSIVTARKGNYGRLLGNCLELRAQIHFKNNDLGHARTDLQSAASLITTNHSTDRLFVKKWNSIIDAVQSQNIDPILSFRAEAQEMRHWESVREADRYSLNIQFDRDRFDFLLFGTPFKPYRDSVAKENCGNTHAATFLLGNVFGPVIDIKTGELRNAGKIAPPTRSIHKLIAALSKDFYRPLSVGGLFAELFPGEHFSILSSVHRVHQSIYRTRRWLEETRLPLAIDEIDGDYSLNWHLGMGFLIPFDRASTRTEDLRLDVLREKFGAAEFTSQEARTLLGVSSTSLKGLIAEAVAAQVIHKTGSGPSTRYHFVVSNKQAA